MLEPPPQEISTSAKRPATAVLNIALIFNPRWSGQVVVKSNNPANTLMQSSCNQNTATEPETGLLTFFLPQRWFMSYWEGS